MEEYQTEKFNGIIDDMVEKPLQDFLETPEKIKAYTDSIKQFPKAIKTKEQKEQFIKERLEADVIVISYSVKVGETEYQNKEFLTIPTKLGYFRSRLKKLRDMNNLPFGDTRKGIWLKKPVDIFINNKGFLSLFPPTEPQEE